MQTVLPLVNLYFDPQRDGYEVSTWSTISGTPIINGSNLLELNGATVIGKADFSRGELTMTINVPHAPTSGDTREWGLYQLNNSAAATFKIDDAVLTAYVCDSDGNTQSTTITQVSSWFNANTKYSVIYSSGAAKFLINGQQVAIFQGSGVPSGPLSVYVKNSYADSLTLNHYQLLMADAHFPDSGSSALADTTISTIASPAPTYTLYQNNSFETGVVKASAGHVYSFSVINTANANRYLQLHNSTAAPASGDSAEFKVFLPPISATGIGTDILGTAGFSLGTGIVVANSTAAGTFTAGTAGDLLIDLFYDGATTTTYMLLENAWSMLLETGDVALTEA